MSTEKRIKIANLLFYITLAIEVVLMIVEKSELNVPFESYVFRLTFLISLVAVLITPWEKKQWIMIACVIIFTFICYRISGRNELLRFSVFVMAAKNINLSKTMKATFYTEAAGFGLIALLSLAGILGEVQRVTDYGREAGEEARYVLGFGHPNTLWGCVYALILMWLWIYGSKAKIWMYLCLLAVICGMYQLTTSRTAFLIGIATFILALIVRYFPLISGKKILYILTGIVTPFMCVAFSTWGAIVSPVPRYEFHYPHYKQIEAIDELLNNRIHDLYRGNEKHAGAIETWKLFSDRMSEEYFDMGWVRLFYWYGIIPAALICILLVVFIYVCYKRRDLWSVLLLLSMSVYTVIEATFVSVYIGRNLMLPIMGVYLCSFSERMIKRNVSKG